MSSRRSDRDAGGLVGRRRHLPLTRRGRHPSPVRVRPLGRRSWGGSGQLLDERGPDGDRVRVTDRLGGRCVVPLDPAELAQPVDSREHLVDELGRDRDLPVRTWSNRSSSAWASAPSARHADHVRRALERVRLAEQAGDEIVTRPRRTRARAAARRASPVARPPPARTGRGPRCPGRSPSGDRHRRPIRASRSRRVTTSSPTR